MVTHIIDRLKERARFARGEQGLLHVLADMKTASEVGGDDTGSHSWTGVDLWNGPLPPQVDVDNVVDQGCREMPP